MDLYKIQYQEAKKSQAILHSGFSHTNQLVKEHNDTLQSYTSKVQYFIRHIRYLLIGLIDGLLMILLY